jgi:hypothetical protein
VFGRRKAEREIELKGRVGSPDLEISASSNSCWYFGTRSSDVLVSTVEGRKWISSVHFASIGSTTNSLETQSEAAQSPAERREKEKSAHCSSR